MSSNRKGDRGERDLVNALDPLGFAVMRAPASGSATERELPDVLAGNGETFYAIEAKSSSGDPIYLDADEIADLVFFADKFGATPLIAAKFNVEHGDHAYGVDGDPGHRFFTTQEVETDRGAFRVKREKWAASDCSVLSEQFQSGTIDQVNDA